MSIEAIGSIGSIGATEASVPLFKASTPAANEASPFAATLDQIATLNTKMVENEAAVGALAHGETGDLHRVMMSIESARMQFDLLLQVRNKLLDAYQELMRMQV